MFDSMSKHYNNGNTICPNGHAKTTCSAYKKRKTNIQYSWQFHLKTINLKSSTYLILSIIEWLISARQQLKEMVLIIQCTCILTFNFKITKNESLCICNSTPLTIVDKARYYCQGKDYRGNLMVNDKIIELKINYYFFHPREYMNQ